MKTTIQRLSLYVSATAVTALVHASAFAQFAGPTPDIGTPSGGDPESIRRVITTIITAILNFLALVAVVIVVIAGIRLIVSQGEEDAKEKAKKTILYALVGLVIVLFARIIVELITEYLAGQV
jgi:hypothetical protein